METTGKMRKNQFVAVLLIISFMIVFTVSCSKNSEPDLSSGVSRNTLTTDQLPSDSDNRTESTTEAGAETPSGSDPEPDVGYYFNDYFGLTRSEILNWLYLHEADDYYLGTPYGDEEIGFNTDTCMRPNGRFSDNYPHMTCTGFVLDVLMQAAIDRSEDIYDLAVKMMELCESYGWWNDGQYYINVVNAYYWGAFVNNYEDGKIYSVKFDTVKDLLTSHLAKKGDIIYFMPDTTAYGRNEQGYPCDIFGNPIDCHIGFYWGEDNSGQDLFWHSMNSGLVGDPMENSLGDFNQISKLTTPSVYSYVLLIPIR